MRWARRFFFSLLVLLAVAAAAEGGARLVWTESDLRLNAKLFYLRDHPTRFWQVAPHLHLKLAANLHLDTNSLGLRDEEVVLPRPAGVTRILCLGESTTWGHGVEVQQAYPAQLEVGLNRALQERGDPRRVDVINAGVPAWTVWQSAVYLGEDGLALQPDVVVIYHLINDFLPMGIVDGNSFLVRVRYTDRQLYERRRPWAPLLALGYHSHLYRRLRKALLRLPAAERGSWGAEPAAGVRVPPQDRQVALDTMAQLCRRAGVQLVVVRPLCEPPCRLYEDPLLQAFAAERHLPLVDIPSRWEQAGEPLGGAFFVDNGHPGPEGHTLIAGWIQQVLWTEVLGL